MRLGTVTPVLRIFDEAKAKEFYLDFLGFRLEWEHRFADDMPLYFCVVRDDCLLHLTEHHGDCSPGSALRIETQVLADYQQELLAKHYRYAKPQIERMPWGSWDMRIADPFGNRLTFTQMDPEASESS
jgi:catechol 2,3-dioxygenase-like lactoylglutathione lyase family enzyme